ncbi:hypothetical protein FACS1894199_05430 [Bacteroidia bacterium]|nr:hypothetical protein FACS1894199_05430 [Bacteroidia bacterium]
MAEFIAALDIGADKIVMALAEVSEQGCRLCDITMIATRGLERGIVTDKERLRSDLRYMVQKLGKSRKISIMNIALSYKLLHISDYKVNVPIHRKIVKENDLLAAQLKCRGILSEGSEELVDLLPIGYKIDRERRTRCPLGKSGKTIDVRFRIYTAEKQYLDFLRNIFVLEGIDEVAFYPDVRAYMGALSLSSTGQECEEDMQALVDLGGAHIGIYLFAHGLAIEELVLPLGCDVIDRDITSRFKLDTIQLARKLKKEYGESIKVPRNDKIQLPELKKAIDKIELTAVIQSRMEELLEGVVYQLQQWNCTQPEHKIYLTGGGSKLVGADILLERLSGQQVSIPMIRNDVTTDVKLVETPECLLVLGLLSCTQRKPSVEKEGFFSFMSGMFK